MLLTFQNVCQETKKLFEIIFFLEKKNRRFAMLLTFQNVCQGDFAENFQKLGMPDLGGSMMGGGGGGGGEVCRAEGGS